MIHSTTTQSLTAPPIHPPIHNIPTSNSQTFSHQPYNAVYPHHSYNQSYSHRLPPNAINQPYTAASYQAIMPQVNYQSTYLSTPYNSYQTPTQATTAPYLLIQHQPYGQTSYQSHPVQHKDANTNISSSLSSVSLNNSTNSNDFNQQFSSMSINATTNSTNITQVFIDSQNSKLFHYLLIIF
jgi:hypothetical protein